MTVRLSVRIEPVEATAKVEVKQERGGDVVYDSTFNTPVPTESPTLTVEVGDKLSIIVEAGDKIVYDKDQFAAGVEPREPPVVPPHPETKPGPRAKKENA